MSIKNILITERADPVLRQLAMRFLRQADVRLFCFDSDKTDGEERLLQMLATEQGEIRFRGCKDIFVDEIWHTANSTDSLKECRKKTERALLFARRKKVPVVHYVSASTVAVLRSELFTDATAQHTEHHRLNETAVEQSGCKFRIYRLPLSMDSLSHAASVWSQFFQHLSRFKDEIEDRVPGYFAAQPLRLCLRGEGTIDLARISDLVLAMEQIIKNDVDGIYFHIRTQQPLSLKDCVQAMVESIGMRVQTAPNGEQQNYVDRLFGMRMEKFLRDLERSGQTTTKAGTKNSSAEQVWVNVPSISPQDLIAAFDLKSQNAPQEAAGWKSGFKRKQVLLPGEVALNYYVGGEGQKTLVLLNAYGQSFRYWERFIQAVSPQLRIILWVPRGNDGDTIGLKVATPQAVHADDLEKVLQQEKIESCTLLAWCSGPKLALEYNQRYPARVSSMVFVAGSFKGLRQHKALETEYEKNLESLLEAIAKYPGTADVVLEYLKGILLAQGKQARSIHELGVMSDHDLQQALSAVNVSLQELVLHPFHAANVVAYAQQMSDFWKNDFVAALEKIEVPVLFVGGDCDRIASQAIAKLVAGMTPHAKYLEIKGGTHYIHYDQWDLLAEVIEQIVNSSDKLGFKTPWPDLSEFHQESMTAR